MATFLLAIARRASRGHWKARAKRHLQAHLGLGALSVLGCMAYGSWLAWKSSAGIPVLTAALFLPSLALALRGVLAARSACCRPVKAVLLSAALFAMAAQWKLSWLDPLRKNPESPSTFAREVLRRVGSGQLHAIGGIKEETLFYLGRSVEILEPGALLTSDLSGHAIVRKGDLPGIAARAEVVAVDNAPRRRDEDRLVLVRVLAESRP